MNRQAAPVVVPTDSLVAFARAIHGVLTPFVITGSTLIERAVSAAGADGVAHEIAPASDVWQQQSANEPLRGAALASVDFHLENTGILEEVHRGLFALDKGPLRAELVAIDLQEPGARVEPKLPACDGVLVIALPSRFFGGELAVAHRGAIELIRWGGEIESDPEPRRIRWAAFSSSVKWQVERVRQGCRVALVFALHRTQAADAHTLDEGPHVNAMRVALRGLKPQLDLGAVLAVPCEGSYSSAPRFVHGANVIEPVDIAALSERDARLAIAAQAQGLRVRVRGYVLDARAGETFRLERFVEARRAPLASDERKKALEALTAKTPAIPTDKPIEENWVIDPPRLTGMPKRYEFDGRTPRALFEHLPSVEPAPVEGIVRADSASAALYLYSALLLDGVDAKETAPLSARPPRAEPKKSDTSDSSSKSAHSSSHSKSESPPAKAPAKKPAAKPAPARASAAPAKSPAKSPAKKPSGKSEPAPAKRASAASAVMDFKKGLEQVLSRIESKSSKKRS